MKQIMDPDQAMVQSVEAMEVNLGNEGGVKAGNINVLFSDLIF